MCVVPRRPPSASAPPRAARQRVHLALQAPQPLAELVADPRACRVASSSVPSAGTPPLLAAAGAGPAPSSVELLLLPAAVLTPAPGAGAGAAPVCVLRYRLAALPAPALCAPVVLGPVAMAPLAAPAGAAAALGLRTWFQVPPAWREAAGAAAALVSVEVCIALRFPAPFTGTVELMPREGASWDGSQLKWVFRDPSLLAAGRPTTPLLARLVAAAGGGVPMPQAMALVRVTVAGCHMSGLRQPEARLLDAAAGAAVDGAPAAVLPCSLTGRLILEIASLPSAAS